MIGNTILHLRCLEEGTLPERLRYMMTCLSMPLGQSAAVQRANLANRRTLQEALDRVIVLERENARLQQQLDVFVQQANGEAV